MSDEHLVEYAPAVERGVPRVWAQLRRTYLVVIAILVVVVVLSLAANVATVLRLADITAAQDRNACSDRLIGFAFGTAAHTLLAPPSPSAARATTGLDFLRASDRLVDADRVCARGVPKPLPPTR